MVLTKIRDVQRLPHFSALKHRDYRFTWTANMFSGAAMWTFIVAVSWLILQKSDRSGDVGIVTFASMIPFLLVSPVAGLIADRFDRRRVAWFTFIANGILTAIVTVLVFADVLVLWHLAALTFMSGCMRSMQEPAMASLIPNQVPQEDLLNAITLNAATRHGARFFGLLVASPLLAIPFIGVSGVLVLSVACQVTGTLFISLARTRSTGDALAQRGLLRSMIDGLVYIYTDRMIAIFILLVAFHCALVMSFDSVFPVFTRNELGAVDGSILGWIVMAFGAGSLVGVALMAGVRSERRKGQWLLWTGIISGLTPILLAFSPGVSSAIGIETFTIRMFDFSFSISPNVLGSISSVHCDGRGAVNVHGADDYLRSDDCPGSFEGQGLQPVHTARGWDNGLRQPGVWVHCGRLLIAAYHVRLGYRVPGVPVGVRRQPAGSSARLQDGSGGGVGVTLGSRVFRLSTKLNQVRSW